MPLPLAGSEVPAVLTAPPTIITNLRRTTPCVRARVVPPRIAGTLKIWGSDQRLQPSAASKPTNLVFPPPADAIAEDTSAIPKRGS
jgi:hypothetical protein